MASARHLIESIFESEDTNVVCAWCGTLQSGDPDASLTSHSICPDCSVEMNKELEQLPTNQIHPDRTSRARKLPECITESAAQELENIPGVDVDWDMFEEEAVHHVETHKYYERMAKLAAAKIEKIKRDYAASGESIGQIYVVPAPYWISINVYSDDSGSDHQDYAVDLLDIFGGSVVDYDDH